MAWSLMRRLHWSQRAAPTRNQCNECPFHHTSTLWGTYAEFQRDCQLENLISICLADLSRSEDGHLCSQESHLERTRSCSSMKSCPYLLSDKQSHSCTQMRCSRLRVGLGRFWRGYLALFFSSFSVVLNLIIILICSWSTTIHVSCSISDQSEPHSIIFSYS